MSDTEKRSDAEHRRAVREAVENAGRSLLSTVVWTVLAALGALVGLQSLQIAFYGVGTATVGFAAFGVVVTAASAYLLYDLHWA
ncbi:hypothetical protein [Halobacterium hubeiense]|uniref:hypothetical protein n=1 Tax=Halobacterium hubeiense TaxID=1407499 RepID=UPI003C738AEC